MKLEPKKKKISKNEVSTYPCDKREYAATTAGSLKILDYHEDPFQLEPNKRKKCKNVV